MINSETKTAQQLQQEADIYLIGQMGYDTSAVSVTERGYVVEGDILLRHEYLAELKTIEPTRQTQDVSRNVVSAEKRTINIVTSGVLDYYDAIQEAIDYWNQKAQCAITFATSGAGEIVISAEYNSDNDDTSLMFVTPPDFSGNPGSVIINMSCTYRPGTGTTQARDMILHAIGHAIGFGHTACAADSNPEGFPIPGLNSIDEKSIMTKETNPLRWSGFSENDIKAFKAIYPTDEPEPEPEPEPDIDPSIPWIYSQDDFDIELSVRDFSEDTPYVFQNYVKQTGDFWYYHENKQKYIRITDANGRVVALGKANESYSIPYGEYTLQYGVLVESVLCGEAKVKFWQTQPRIWTNARENETIDLAREYVVKCEFDTNSPDWQEYTKSVKMVDTGTTEEVPLRFSETADRWYFRFPDRGTYKIILTVTNRLGETKTAEKTLQITSIDRTPVFYKMYEEYVGIEYGYLKNNEAVSRFSLRFYSDAACTRRIASTENTIECSYILWDDYYDIDSEPVSSTIQEQGTFLIPVGSSTCELPHDIFNGTPYTLDQHIFRYEITGFYYK